MDVRQVQLLDRPPTYETVAAFVKSVLSYISSLPPDDDADIFVCVESSVSTERLTAFLTSLTNIEIPPSKESLKTLQNFLDERWERIKKTDAIYSHQPNSKINRVCLHLAKTLAHYHGVHPFELLMPTTEHWMNYFPHHATDSLKLNEFIMRDNDKPLSVIDGFKLIEHEVTSSGPLPDSCAHINGRLTLGEDRLLCKHSDAADKYYRVLKSRVSEVEAKQRAKAEFEQFMSNMSADFKPGSTYDVTGKKKLARSIMSYICDRKNTVALFAHSIPINKWPIFQALIPDDEFFRYFCGVNVKKMSFESELQYKDRLLTEVESAFKALLMPPSRRELSELYNILMVVEDINRKKAALHAYIYCLLQLYRRMRMLQPETTSKVINFASKFFQVSAYACTKEEKLNACTAIESILLNSRSMAEIIDALEGEQLAPHKKAIQDGLLGDYLKVIKDVIERVNSIEDPMRRGYWVRTVA